MAKKTAKKKTAKKTGRPKTVFTPAQIKKMNTLALNGCQNNTIATIMDIPHESIVRRFGKQLTKKRCERKNNLRKMQNAAAKKGNPALLIFLGKNELNQADKCEVDHGITDDLAILMKEIGGVGACLPIKTKNKV
jgi:hypothetical protein